MRVLVTGGAGFIGSTLVDRLLADGHQVTVVDDLSTGRLANLHHARRDADLPLSFQRLDITSSALERAIAKARPEVVCHLAAQIDVRASVTDPVGDAMINVIGTVALLDACRRHEVRKVVNTTSGGCVYGEPDPADLPVVEDYVGHPVSPYGAAKLGTEEYLHAFEALYGLRWTSLALANVYGPRQDPGGEAGVVSVFAARMRDDRQVTIYGDGAQTRDFVYVDDVVDAYVAALHDGDNQRFNVGTGTEISITDLFAALADITGADRRPLHEPARPGEPSRIALDVTRAAEVLGWRPRTPLREGLFATVDWLRG